MSGRPPMGHHPGLPPPSLSIGVSGRFEIPHRLDSNFSFLICRLAVLCATSHGTGKVTFYALRGWCCKFALPARKRSSYGKILSTDFTDYTDFLFFNLRNLRNLRIIFGCGYAALCATFHVPRE